MSQHIKVEHMEAVTVLTLNRPDAKNALTQDMYRCLCGEIDAAAHSNSNRALVITGSHRCFTAGNDLYEFSEINKIPDVDNPVLQFMLKLSSFPKPIVVAVDGLAVGIGTTMLLHCDFVYASAHAEFRVPFVDLGLCPEFASSFLLSKTLGGRRANELLLLGKPFSAEEAETYQLVNAVCENPFSVALATARSLSVKPPVALRQTKALIRAGNEKQIEASMHAENHVFMRLLEGVEFAAASAAFIEKHTKGDS